MTDLTLEALEELERRLAPDTHPEFYPLREWEIIALLSLAREAFALRATSILACGHPAALLIKSVESDYSFCELCEARSERGDALKMEERYSSEARALRAENARLREAMRRLSSMEAFGVARAIRPGALEDDELLQRIEFAAATLEPPHD